MHKHYEKAGVKVLAVIAEADRDKISGFREEFRTSYTILADPKNSVWKLYDLQTSPTTIIMGKSGIVHYIGGFTTWTEMIEQVELIRAKKSN